MVSVSHSDEMESGSMQRLERKQRRRKMVNKNNRYKAVLNLDEF